MESDKEFIERLSCTYGLPTAGEVRRFRQIESDDLYRRWRGDDDDDDQSD